MGNLVLSRHEGERLLLETTEGQIVIKVVKVNSGVKLAVSAPASVRILREELLPKERVLVCVDHTVVTGQPGGNGEPE